MAILKGIFVPSFANHYKCISFYEVLWSIVNEVVATTFGSETICWVSCRYEIKIKLLISEQVLAMAGLGSYLQVKPFCDARLFGLFVDVK